MPMKNILPHKNMDYKTIFCILAETWPQARCELIHNTPFQLLLAVMLSAQATDTSVNTSLSPLFQAKPQFSCYDLLEMGEKRFATAIQKIGLAPTKARNAIKMCQQLLEGYAGEVPLVREELEKLAGVGRKTANVIMNILGGQPTIAVDTHVFRVSQRIGLVAPTKDRNQVEQTLMRITPKKYIHNAHNILIFHGRYLCKAKNPACSTCPLEKKYCNKIGIDTLKKAKH